MISERLRSLLNVFAAAAAVAFASLAPASAQTDQIACAKESGDKAIEACDRAISQNHNDAERLQQSRLYAERKGRASTKRSPISTKRSG